MQLVKNNHLSPMICSSFKLFTVSILFLTWLEKLGQLILKGTWLSMTIEKLVNLDDFLKFNNND